jgi:hypothetical protein
VVPLGPGSIQGDDRAIVGELIERFEPLEFEAGAKAKAWLETSVSSGALAFPTYLVLSEDESELYGFFALDELEVKVAPYDTTVMEVRKVLRKPRTKPQQATKLVWIARSRSSEPGFGVEMFEYALLVAFEARSVALMVDAFDEATAEMWVRKPYFLREPHAGTDGWTCLWHALGKADQSFN